MQMSLERGAAVSMRGRLPERFPARASVSHPDASWLLRSNASSLLGDVAATPPSMQAQAHQAETEGTKNPLAALLLGLIRFYRRYLSPMKRTSSCRYLPTCSEYAMQAVIRHGAAKGGALAAARILRCNPFFHAGFHPVPEAGRWGACEHEGPH